MFILKKIEGGRINVFEPQKLVAGADITEGLALGINSEGKVVKFGTPAGKPTFIALAAAKSGEEVACGRVESNQIFATKKVSGTIKVGTKCKFNGDYDGIDSSATGAAEVVAVEGNTAYIRFV